MLTLFFRVLFLRSSSSSRARQKPGAAPRAQVDVRSNNLTSIPHYPDTRTSAKMAAREAR